MASSSKKSAANNLLGKREPGDCFWTQPILKKHKEKSEEKEVALRKKTLFVGQLPPQTKIRHILSFFNNVEVFRVQLMLNNKGTPAGYGFVEFASANEAKKALEEKTGEYLCGHKIILDMAKIVSSYPPHKDCIEHKIWHKDYLQRNILVREDEPVEECDEPADFAEVVLLLANLSPQTKIWHINDFFYDVGEVVSVRLIVNHEGKHVGYGFVEFASADEANKALEKKNGEYLHDHRIVLQVVKISPYHPQNKYNLAEILCYEDYLRRESLLIGEKGSVKPPNFAEAVSVRKKTLFFPHISKHVPISDIISLFKDVGEVVSVRLVVNRKGRRVGRGFAEFASANKAKKALEKKNGEILLGKEIVLQLAEIASSDPPNKYYIDHKPCYEDYLRREGLCPLEEDEVVEGLDEPPDFDEEVAARRKTLFVANLHPQIKILLIKRFFNNVSNVVSVRLIVNNDGNHVGCGYVEFASADEANKALENKIGNRTYYGHKLFLEVAKIAPYPPRPRYTLAELRWYELYLRRESLLIEDDLKKSKMVPNVREFSGKKITFSYDD